MAPSRFAANDSVGSGVSANRFAKITLAAKIGRNAIVIAASARGPTGSESSHQLGTSQASASPPSRIAYMTGSGGVGRRLVTSTAASTASSTPAKTSAFTTQRSEEHTSELQ